MTDIVPGSFWRFPAMRFTSLFDDDDSWVTQTASPSGLSVSEDDKNVYVSAALPGVDPKNIEVTYDKGVLWIKGETEQEQKEMKYYRKATGAYSYRVAVPGEIDPNAEPEATCSNGVMTVAFKKSPKSQPKKISVKSDK